MILLAACAIALGLTHAQAQPSTSFGVKAGVNFSTISRPNLIIHGPGDGLETDQFKMKFIPGYHLGLYGRYNFSPAVGVQAEVLYSMAGYKVTTTLLNGTYIRTQLHYLNVPVLFRYTMPSRGFYAELGPQFGYFLKDNIVGTGHIGTVRGGFSDSGEGQAASLSLEGVVGVGYKLDNGVGFALRYQHEFKTSSNVNRLIPDKAQKRGVQLSVTYDLF